MTRGLPKQYKLYKPFYTDATWLQLSWVQAALDALYKEGKLSLLERTNLQRSLLMRKKSNENS